MLNNRNTSRCPINIDTSYQSTAWLPSQIRERPGPSPERRDAWGQRGRRQDINRNRAEARLCGEAAAAALVSAARRPQGPTRHRAAFVAGPGNGIACVFHDPQPGPGGGSREVSAGNPNPSARESENVAGQHKNAKVRHRMEMGSSVGCHLLPPGIRNPTRRKRIRSEK